MESGNSFPEPFPIPETDEELLSQCRVETFMSGGKGGQHQNKTESGVRLVHEATGMVVTSRSERSQHRNKAIALERLRRKLEKRNERPKKRRATRVPKAEREKRIAEKKRRGRVKETRKKPPVERDD
ncbi:MAG: peptide chain release factor-like protein [Gemmatimonadetes bacterium]|nr:peptide chain release factor-like protein [Gemmatimonadota bacterium]